jgi:hypothetical protein
VERAATLVREAQEQATQLRESSTTAANRRTEEAEQTSAEREAAADAYATRAREDAERDAAATREEAEREREESRAASAAAVETELEAAKEEGRGLVQEARAVRERVLGDLGRRRTLLQAQVDELRAGRDRLLDAYRVVKRTLGEATDALAQVEARAGTELAGPPPHLDLPPVEGELAALGGEAGPGATETAPADEPDAPATEAAAVGESAAPDGQPEAEVAPREPESGAAVDALFARLRAEKSETVEVVEVVESVAVIESVEVSAAGEVTETVEVVEVVESIDIALDADSEAPPEIEAEAQADAEGPPEPAPGTDDARRAARATVLDPLGAELTRKAKRTLQDDQNELLDQLRKAKKGRPAASAVLPSVEEATAAWVAVLAEPMTAAYRGGWEQLGDDATGAAPDAAPADLVAEGAAELVARLRDRLVTAIDGPADDEDEVTQRIGARFREFKGQELDAALGDLLAGAWARGTYDAAPRGARLRWIPTAEGHCADCDDNALEPTVRAEPFPTGQPHPPAHPGCRCLLAIATD